MSVMLVSRTYSGISAYPNTDRSMVRNASEFSLMASVLNGSIDRIIVIGAPMLRQSALCSRGTSRGAGCGSSADWLLRPWPMPAKIRSTAMNCERIRTASPLTEVLSA